MPYYNFEVRTETHVMLTKGGEFQDDAAARSEAARRVGELLQEHASSIWVDQDWKMEITNDVGLILYVIHVSASRTSATALAR